MVEIKLTYIRMCHTVFNQVEPKLIHFMFGKFDLIFMSKLEKLNNHHRRNGTCIHVDLVKLGNFVDKLYKGVIVKLFTVPCNQNPST